MTTFRVIAPHAIMIGLEPKEPGDTFDDKGVDKDRIKDLEASHQIIKAVEEKEGGE